ncbi:MAG: C40 family peptidase [Candidatus Marinimicrobia bacterium]|nr:C40 family peptidase [Candidatus Neomarinimicrobiota bacterium]
MTTVIKTPFANIYKEAAFGSMLITQGVMWEKVKILEEKDDWIYLRLPDGYTGWCQRFSLQELSEESLKIYARAKRILIHEPFVEIKSYSSRENGYEKMGMAAFSARFPLLNTKSYWAEVLLPDGTKGWIQQKNLPQMPLRDLLIYYAEKFLGASYFWGGKTENGFDCSGFVQSIFFACNIKVPRDASMQIEFLENSQSENNTIQNGDLAFFRNEKGSVTHVAIMMDEHKYIHASGEVKINSFDPDSPLYNEKLATMMKRAGLYSISSLMKE